jgi:hypothetical protein
MGPRLSGSIRPRVLYIPEDKSIAAIIRMNKKIEILVFCVRFSPSVFDIPGRSRKMRNTPCAA